MNRYSNIDYVMALCIDDGVEIISKAYEKRSEDLLMQRWITHYQHQMTFDEFKSQVTVRTREDNRSREEILDKVYKIIGSTNGVD